MTADAEEVIIDRIGAAGDGIVRGSVPPRYIPFALPGEHVQPNGFGLPRVVSGASLHRVEPECRHFGACGGCIAQHMARELYADWKRSRLADALRHRGLDAEIEPLWMAPSRSRRRATLTAKREEGRIVLGYHRRQSHELLQIEECPVLRDAIAAQLPALRSLAAATGIAQVRITVLATPSGCDVALEAEGRISSRTAAELVKLAVQHRLARLSWNRETLLEAARPVLTMHGIEVVPPPGAFVQATAAAEEALAGHVFRATTGCRQVADLFCGLGTFTFALARSARVTAIDSDRPAIATLQASARRARGLKPISTRTRDLFRDPLSARELQDFDAVVFDPPRAGAREQVRCLARSRVPVVVAVSCNPATLARDLRDLVDGGYRLERVVPIDQFLYSAELEALAVLRR